MPNEESLHPASGARFLFERTAERDDGADYDAAVLTPDTRVDYKAALAEGGGVELTPVAGAAAEPLHKKLHNIAVVIARGAKRKRSNGLDPWPHRVLRWRDV